MVEQGLVGTWIVKDMSRFGRDYLQVGRFTEIVFPSYDVRFIAVNDAVDSAKGDNDFTVIRNVFNDFYAKDTSKKVRSVMKAKGTSGKHLGGPPYGYRSDPQDKDHWILDEDAAPVVKRIFDMTIDGIGPSRIARILESDGVLTVKALYAKQKGKPLPERPHHWIEQSVVNILERMEYTGRTCNFKTYSKSYKLKKCIPTAPEDMFILADTQEAIVPQAQWNRVQELRKNKRRVTKGERQGLFSGLAFCADCGSKLHFGTCSAHYIREEVLRDVVLGDLSRERYQKMSEGYEAEQERLKLEIAVAEEWVERREEMDSNLDRFFALTEKYVDILKLTPTIVNEFIKKSIVYAPDKSSGKRTQEIRIIFKWICRRSMAPSWSNRPGNAERRRDTRSRRLLRQIVTCHY